MNTAFDINSLTIGQAKELAALFGASEAKTTKTLGSGEWVIVRCRDAGVHFGKLDAYEGRSVWLSDSRRLWQWFAKESISLSAVSQKGVKHNDSRIAMSVPKAVLMDACEILFCSEEAAASINSAPVASAK